jgi:PAS domain S-box-containing protein
MTNSIAGYQIVEKLCMTSSSGLYRARQEENGRTALLKLFDLEKPRVERHAQRACCQHEYAFFTTLDLPGIRPIALIDQPGCLAIVLRDFAGEALETVSRKKTFTLRECLIVARELAAILGVVHAAHIVHGDLRPANILIASDLRLCLVDFSLAAREAHQNSTASVERDWTHLSPEKTGRMNRPVDHRTDFYSSGINLYRLFTGQSPFEASDTLEWAHCHIARLPRSPQKVTPALPAVVSDLIMKLLAKVAEERYQSARGLQYDLECCIERMDTTNSIGPFVLGTRDASDRFYIPQKLYGRETELNQLWAGFERMVATRQPALIVVAGASGVGKSVLVHELHRPVVHEHGYFVAGKFAQYQKGIPYAAIVDACQELVRQMMAESEARVAAWKQQLRAGLDVYAQLLIDLMPQLEPILGPQPPVERLAPLEVQQHFQRVFRLFLGSFAAENHPLLPNMQGLAAERAAAACETRGCVEQVRAYLEMASTAYAAWGADRKAAQLHACATQFAERLTVRLAAVSTSQFHDSSSPPTPQVIPAPLDVLSVAKVSQAISGEIVLKKLLDTLMRVVIENAGAQKGCLILLNEAGPFLAAEARVEEQHVTVRQPKNNVPASVMPESVLNYVRRSRERVLIVDALETNWFSGDPYLLAEHPRSLLCLPILRQGELIGMLYLEHRLVSHVFTPDRLAVLELLASQAAISLENAQLYTELKERESRFRRLAESNIIGVFFWHMDGSISEANEAFLKMVGYTSQDLRENKLRWGGLTPPEYGHADERALDEIRRTGACSSYEKEYIRQDGSRVPILIGGALIEGSQDAGIAFVLDLTERKQAEAERAARKAAEAAIEAKSAFLANVSHELRSPLNIMLGFGRFLTRHSDLPPAVKEDLCIMLRNGQHLHTLINQVLDLAKVEAGRSSIEKSDFDLHRLLDELEDMFAFKSEDNGLLLQFKHRDVPRFIRADPLKLRQVLINLLSNALKFTSEGRVTLSAMPIAGPGGMRMQFCVSDTGIGIGSDELTNLFNPFVQASAGLRAQEGTGLGLAISRSFVRMMGGDIHIESAPGEGTTVSFDIPVQVAGAEAVAASTVRSSRRVVGVKSGQQSYRILVVDDRQDARQLLLRLLTPLGFNVREAGNGQEAVNASRMWRPHLVWMDLRMPVMDGLEAARRIKATTEARDTVIIALTASSYEEERADILAAGCDDFLRKPFEENELFGLMQKHLAVTFAYEDDDSKIRDLRSKIDSAALEALPEDVRRSLEQALIQLDAEALATAIGEVPHAPLAQALETLAHEFQYSKMLQLIHGADGKD